MPETVPVLFMVFNRPEVTAKAFAAIRAVRPAKLYVAADGPRVNKPGEKELCDATRKVATAVDWPCTVKTLFQKENLGCRKAVITAINWFFENEEEGIIVEDDCVADPTFFSFCKEMLTKYRDNPRIMHISGDNFQYNGGVQVKESYFFSKFIHLWGWATWRRAWKKLDAHLDNLEKAKKDPVFLSLFDSADEKRQYLESFERAHTDDLSTWEFEWIFTVWYNQGLAIYPNKNLVQNIGFLQESTHTESTRKFIVNTPLESMEELIHPSVIERNIAADRFTFNRWYRVTWYMKAARLLPKSIYTVLRKFFGR